MPYPANSSHSESTSLPKVAVVILNWNDVAATIRCCESVLRSMSAVAKNCTGIIWIVDNGSEKQNVALLKEWCAASTPASCSVVFNSSNLGFAGGINAGISAALPSSPDFFLLLNNDVEISENAIAALIDFSENHVKATLVGTTLVDLDTGLVQSAGGYTYFPWLGYSRPLLAGLTVEDIEVTQAQMPDYISGAAMWLRGDFVRRIEGLPTDHFLYFEELELNQRLEGEENQDWCREAVVSHKGGGSLKTPELEDFATYHAALSAFRYTQHYHPWFLPTVIIARVAGISVRAIAQGRSGPVRAVFEALLRFMRPQKK